MQILQWKIHVCLPGVNRSEGVLYLYEENSFMSTFPTHDEWTVALRGGGVQQFQRILHVEQVEVVWGRGFRAVQQSSAFSNRHNYN